MISAIAVLLAFIILAVSSLMGGGLTLAGFLSVRKKDISIGYKILLWLCGVVPSAVLWIILIRSKIDFSSPGGPPAAEDWENLFRFFSLAALLPGICMAAGGIIQLIAGLFIKKRQSENEF